MRSMLTFYCPECWGEIQEENMHCPYCGYELAQDQALSFEARLLRSLDHSVPERRYLAIQILGKLRSEAAIPGLARILETETTDIYALREALEALSRIGGRYSRNVLRQATRHAYPLIRQLALRLLKETKND